MSAQVAIYISAFLGMCLMMGAFAALTYRKHRQMVNERRAYERLAQERIKQAQGTNSLTFPSTLLQMVFCSFIPLPMRKKKMLGSLGRCCALLTKLLLLIPHFPPSRLFCFSS